MTTASTMTPILPLSGGERNGEAPRTRAVRLAAPEVVADRRPDGTIYLQSPHALPAYPDKLTERLEYWAAHTPDQTFIAQRDASGGWRRLSYAQTLAEVRRIAQGLLRRNLSAERPIAILSGNDIEHALLGFAAMVAGIPYAPVSPAYSLVSTDFAKLRHVLGKLTPGLVFAADGGAFARAIDAVVAPDVEIVVTRNPLGSRPTTPFAALAEEPTADVDAAHAKVGPDTIVKFLFTSGSTGQPKGVINTQRMWCSNQMMILQAIAYFADEPPVIVDWAPWHHTSGGNHDLGLVLFNGGTFYIDDGKPLPGAIETTVRNLREIPTNWYFNVPKGFEALVPFLRNDAALRQSFFSELKVLWFAAAAIAQHVFDEIQELAVRTVGERILFCTGLGATETAPFAMSRTWPTENAANVGLPAVGLVFKLVPSEDRYEVRLKGPSITPGYWREPALTEAAFDEEGFYKLGDALKFADPHDPAKGLLFAGRIAEDFKLATGTWVNLGPLRAQIINHFAPFVRDVVIAGADRDFLSALVFPDLDECRAFAGLGPDTAPAAVLDHGRLRTEFARRLDALAKASTGSSNRIARLFLLAEPPSLDRGEATDKGSINQRAVLRQRADIVEELYATPVSPRVIAIEGAT